jgi:ABC-type nitrate/sulfonate/bicarbonate transport system permease component
VILLIFGLGVTPAVVYGVLQGFFPVCLLVAGGVRDTERQPLVVARSMGATTWQVYRKVILPAVLPAVLAGMRLAIVFCLLGVLVVEMFGGIRGVGFLLTTIANAFRAAELFAATALVSVLGRRRPPRSRPEPPPQPLALRHAPPRARRELA